MAKLNEQFKTFLTNINPNEKAVEYASEAHSRVRECLEKDEDYKEFIEGSFLYGSYKRHTAVGDIKDVDVVILTNFDTESEEHAPAKALRKLKAALARCYDDSENPQYQRRSIRVDDPLPDNPDALLTLDVIPAVIQTDENSPLLVPDREQKEWIQSHPRGHLRYTSDLNSEEQGKKRFVPLVKIMKWWWKYQCELQQPDVERPKPKGFWIECLTAHCFDTQQIDWADHFIAVLENAVSLCSSSEEVPKLPDPGLKGHVIQSNITKSEFKIFIDTVKESLDLATAARDEEDKRVSSEIWRGIFGDVFPLYDEDEIEEARANVTLLPLSDTSHAQPLKYPYKPNRKYKVKIDAYLYIKTGSNLKKLGGINSGSRVLSNNLLLKFIASTRAKGEYEVIWQVVNTGQHAYQCEGLRGDFFKAKLLYGAASKNPLINWERTEYSGNHWIECFIIKDGICVARSGRFEVKVSNTSWKQ